MPLQKWKCGVWSSPDWPRLAAIQWRYSEIDAKNGQPSSRQSNAQHAVCRGTETLLRGQWPRQPHIQTTEDFPQLSAWRERPPVQTSMMATITISSENVALFPIVRRYASPSQAERAKPPGQA